MTHYLHPKKGLFSVHAGIWQNGWLQKEEEAKIIGEDADSYITRIVPSSHGEWVGDQVIERHYNTSLGYHKSRLLRWLPTQLALF
jgi:hypothetical protein